MPTDDEPVSWRCPKTPFFLEPHFEPLSCSSEETRTSILIGRSSRCIGGYADRGFGSLRTTGFPQRQRAGSTDARAVIPDQHGVSPGNVAGCREMAIAISEEITT